ncbi:hypothetical protein FB451DRAFT_1380244 [Mycena latifolia]|nr:hypothetical protein FB451DRAFT_1380244 [Mycena latifolia]
MAANYPSLDGTFGALEIGTTVGTFLFGILTLPAFNYYRQFPQDSKLLKTTCGSFFLSACNEVDENKVYCTTVTSYGQAPDAFILQPPRSLIFTLLFTAGIDSLVQVFFGNRIRVLSGRPHVFFLCLTIAVLEFICDMVLMTAIWKSNMGLLIIQSKAHWIAIMSATLVPVGDFVMALSMCYSLWNIRESGSQFRR